MCKRQSRKVVWDMIITPFLPTLQQLSNLLLLLSFSTSKHMAYGLWPLVPLFQISLKNSELKTTHNTFRDCRVRFFGQPFSKQLYNPHPYPLHHQGQTADTGYGLRQFERTFHGIDSVNTFIESYPFLKQYFDNLYLITVLWCQTLCSTLFPAQLSLTLISMHFSKKCAHAIFINLHKWFYSSGIALCNKHKVSNLISPSHQV